MASATPLQFTLLNDTNYETWQIQMEAALIEQKLWSVVNITIDPKKSDGSDRTETKMLAEYTSIKRARDSAAMMAEARAMIIMRVDPSQLSHMRDHDPMEVWINVRNVHRAHGFATSLALHLNSL